MKSKISVVLALFLIFSLTITSFNSPFPVFGEDEPTEVNLEQISTSTIVVEPITIQVYNPDGSDATDGSVVLKEYTETDGEFVIEGVGLSPEGTCVITPPHSGDFRLIAFPDRSSNYGISETLYIHVDESGQAAASEESLDPAVLTFRIPDVKGSITSIGGELVESWKYEISIRSENPEDRIDIQPEIVNEDGTYTVLGLPAGSYFIKALSRNNTDADSLEVPLVIPASEPPYRIDLQLTAPQLTGTVMVSASGGAVVQGGCIEFYDSNQNYMQGNDMPSIGPDGTFKISGLQDGIYYIQPKSQDETLEALHKTRLEILDGQCIDPGAGPITLEVQNKVLRVLHVENRVSGDDRYEFILKNFSLLQNVEDWNAFEARIIGDGVSFTNTDVYVNSDSMDYASDVCRMYIPIDTQGGIQCPYGQYQLELTHEGEPVEVLDSNTFLIGANVYIGPKVITKAQCGSKPLTVDVAPDPSEQKFYNWNTDDTLEVVIYSHEDQGSVTCNAIIADDLTLSFTPPVELANQNEGWKTIEIYRIENENGRIFVARGGIELGDINRIYQGEVQEPYAEVGVKSLIHVEKKDGSWDRWFPTYENGKFYLYIDELNGEGAYTLEAFPEDSAVYCVSRKSEFSIAPLNAQFEPASQIIKLQVPALTANVKNPDGLPASGGQLIIHELIDDRAEYLMQLSVDENGVVLIPALDNGRYAMVAFPDEQTEAVGALREVLAATDGTFTLEGASGPTSAITFTYQKAQMKGNVKNSDGDALKNWEYEIWTIPQDDQNMDVVTVHKWDGYFIAGGFAEGNYKIALISNNFNYADTWYDVTVTEPIGSVVDFPLTLSPPQVKGIVVLPSGETVQEGWINILDENGNPLDIGSGIWENEGFRIGGLKDGNYSLRVELPNEEGAGYPPYVGTFSITIENGACTNSNPMNMNLIMQERKPNILSFLNAVRGSETLNIELGNAGKCIGDGYEPLMIKISGNGQNPVYLSEYNLDYRDDYRDVCYLSFDFKAAQNLPYGEYTLSLYEGSIAGTALDSRPMAIACHVITNPSVIPPDSSSDIDFSISVETTGDDSEDYPWESGETVKVRLISDAYNEETHGPVWVYETQVVVNSEKIISVTLSQDEIPVEGLYYVQVLKAGIGDTFLGFGDFEVGDTLIREILASEGDKMITLKGDYLRKYRVHDAFLELYMNGDKIATTTQFNHFWGDLQWFVPYRLISNDTFTVKLFANGEWVVLNDNSVNVIPTLSCEDYLINEGDIVTINAFQGLGWLSSDVVTIRIRPSWSNDVTEGQLISSDDVTVFDNQISFVNSSDTHTEFISQDNPGVTFPLNHDSYMLEVFNATGERVGLTEIYVDNTSNILSGTVKNKNDIAVGQCLARLESVGDDFHHSFLCGPDGEFYFLDKQFGIPQGTYRLWVEAPYFLEGANSTTRIIILDEDGFWDENHEALGNVVLQFNETQVAGRITLPSFEPLRQGDVLVYQNEELLFTVPVGMDGSYKIGGLADGDYMLVTYAFDQESLMNAVPVHITIANGSPVLNIDMSIRNARMISGTLSLSQGRVAPEGGLRMNLAAIDENSTPQNYDDDMYYWQSVTIPQGESSADYSVKVAADNCSYRVRFFSDNQHTDDEQFGYVIAGTYSETGTVFSRAQATLVTVDQHNVTDINISLVEGKILSGTISFPEGTSFPQEEAELSISVVVMMDNGTADISEDDYGFVRDLILAQDELTVAYSFRVPENPAGLGYRLEYELGEFNPFYSQNGYYTANGTVSRYEAHELIDVRSGNAINKNLTLVAKEVPILLDPDIDGSGSKLIVYFSKPMDEASLRSEGLTLSVNGTSVAFDSGEWQSMGDEDTYCYTIPLKDILIFKEDMNIQLSYDGTGSIRSQEGILLNGGSWEVANLSTLKLNISGVIPGSLNNRNITLVVSASGIELTIKKGADTLASGTGTLSAVIESDGVHTLVIGSPKKLKPATITFSIDKIAPGVSVEQCSSVTNNFAGVTPDITLTGDYLASTSTVTLNGERYTEGTAIKAPGHYILIASAKDAAGNLGSATKEFDILWDMQAPVIDTNIVSGTTYESLTPVITLTSVIVGDHSNLTQYAYTAKLIYGDGHSVNYTKGQNISPLTAEGLYRLEVRAVNPSYTDILSEKTYAFTLDGSPPSVSISGVTANGVYNTLVTPIISLTDTVATYHELINNATTTLTKDGILVASYKLGDTLILDGSYILSVQTKDQVNHIASESVSFKIDRTRPVITVKGALDGFTYNNTNVTLSAIVNEGTLTATSNGQTLLLNDNLAEFTGTPNGVTTYRVILKAEDEAHNITQKEIIFTIDRLPINLVIRGISEGQLVNYSPAISFIAYEGTDEKTGAIATLDGNPYNSATQLSDGNHTLVVKFVEGDTTTTKTVHFSVDKTAPLFSEVTMTKGGQLISQNTFVRSGDTLRIKAHLSDTNGLSEVRFNLGAIATGIVMSYNESSRLYEGVYTVGEGNFSGLKLTLRAIDRAGNTAENKSYVHTISIDNTKPSANYTVTPAAPDGNNGVYKSPTMSIALMGSLPNDALYYVLNNTPGQAIGSKILAPAQGDNVLHYYTIDQAGNKSDEKLFVFKYDSAKPANVVLSSTVSDRVNVPRVSLSGSVAGEGASTRVLIRNQVTSELVAITNLKSDGSFILSDISLRENENYFMLYAVDYAGNISNTGTTVIRTLDSIAPLMTIEKLNDSDNQYTLQANEPVTGLYVMFNGEVVVSENISGSGASYTIMVPNSTEGANTLCVWATDAAGNTGTGSYTSTYIPANTEQSNVSVGGGTTMDIPARAFQQEIQMLVKTVDMNNAVGYKPITAPVSFEFTNTIGGTATVHEPILIRIQIGMGLKGVLLMHIHDDGTAGEPVAATEVTSAYLSNRIADDTIALDTPYYVTDTGELVFKTVNFSTYGAVVDNTAPIITVPNHDSTVNKVDYVAMGNRVVLLGNISDSSNASITKVTVDGQQLDLSGFAAGDLDKTFSIVIPISADGYHEVYLIASDIAGNQSNTYQVTYTMDINTPVLSASFPIGLTNLNTVNLSVQTNEMVDIYIDGTLKDHNSGSFSLPLPLNNDGDYTFNIRAVDASGNSSDAYSVSITRDATAPLIEITGANNGDIYGRAVTIDVNVQGHTGMPEITLDGAIYVPGTYSTEGQHVLNVTATDEAGNTSTQTIRFAIDTSVPTINLAGVAGNGLYSNDKTLSISAENADSLTVTKLVNGGAPQIVTTTGMSASLDLTAASDQQNTYLVQVSATKNVGGQIRCASSSIRVTIDKKAPTLTVSAPIQTESPSVTLSGSVDEIADIYLNGQLVLDGAQPGSFSLAGLSLVLGDNSFTVKSVDRAGHETTKTAIVKRVEPANQGGGSGGGGGFVPPAIGPVQPGTTVTGSIIDSNPVIHAGTASSTIEDADLQKAMNNAKADFNGNKTIQINIAGGIGVNRYDLILPAITLAKGTANQKYIISTSLASITLPGNMFASRDTKNPMDMGISISNVDKTSLSKELRDKIGNRPGIELIALEEGKKFSWSNESAPVTIALDYTPTAEELKDTDFIVVWYIDGNGKVTEVPNGRYDPATKKVIFTVTHFSKYVVSYSKKTYDDISKAYGKPYIEALASKGFYTWIAGNAFNPNRNITRAEFIYLLMTALDLHAEIDSNFTDIKTTDYYYYAVGAAKKLGITSGIGNNKLGANLSITRQDMATILCNALKSAKKPYEVGNIADLDQFADGQKIASYAKASLAMLNKAGVLVGYNKIIDPDGNFNMQQAAVVIYKIYKK